jgi:hypothetical protein
VLGFSGSLTQLTDGSSYLIAGSNITITSASNGAVTIASTGGGTPGGSDTQMQFNDGGSFGGTSLLTFDDTDFLLGASTTTKLQFRDSGIFINSPSNGDINVVADEKVLIMSGGNASSTDEAQAGDVAFYVSGAVGHTNGKALFGGDVTTSGSLVVDKATVGVLGFSGSLTQLTDGSSYLIAGSNVTITSASNGAVTIASTGGGTPGGSDTQLQFNDGGSFGGTSLLTFDDTDFLLGASTTTKLQFRDTGIFINSPANGELHIDSDGKVLIMSGGAASSTNEAVATDISFYVSGGVGGSSGKTLFGGDITTSGSLIVDKATVSVLGFSGSLTQLTDGSSYIIAGTGMSVASESNGAITLSSAGTPGGSDTQMQFNDGGSFGGTSLLTFDDTDFLLGASTTTKLQFRDTGIFLNSPSNGELHIDADGKVLIMSGGSAASANEAAATDVSFYVSGTSGGTTGKTLFGGDITTSGSLIVDKATIGVLGFSGSLTQLTDGTSYIIAGAGMGVSSASNGAITLTSTAGTPGGSDTQLQFNDGGSFGGTSLLTFDDTDFLLGAGTTTKLQFRDTGIFINSPANGEMNIDADGKVLIMSGGAASSTNSAAATDVSLYVSGAVGGTDGKSLFEGDVVTSGSLVVDKATVSVLGFSGSLTQLTDGSSYLIAGNNMTITSASNGAVTIDGPNAAPPDAQYVVLAANTGLTNERVLTAGTGITTIDAGANGAIVLLVTGTFNEPTANNIVSTASVSFAGGQGPTHKAGDVGTDVYFFSSGTVGARGGGTAGVGVFGGDLHISGNLTVDGSTAGAVPGGSDTQLQFNDGGSFGGTSLLTFDDTDFLLGASSTTKLQFRDTGIFLNSPIDGQLHIDADGKVLIMSGGAAADTNEASGLDVSFYVSGSVGSQGSSTSGTTLFGGDAFASGTLKAALGLSGSLTQLTDGTSAFIAGSGVTVTSASNGAVTIAASTTPGGSDTQMQFNDGGSLAGTALMTFDDTDFLVGSSTTTKLQFRDSDIFINSPVDGELNVKADNKVLIMSGGNAASTNESIATDISFYVSGAVSHTAGKSLFGGDVTVSGSLIAVKPVIGVLGISGSHTALIDGTSAFIAGEGITITSASNGAVTIASSGEGSGVAGSDGQIQYNNGGSFGGAAGLVYDDSNNRVGVVETTPTSTLHISGSFANSGIEDVTSAMSPYTVIESDYFLKVNTSSGAVTINLPAASGVAGRTLIIKDANRTAGTNNITIDPNSSETIDGSATLVLASNNAAATIICDGSNWFTIGLV